MLLPICYDFRHSLLLISNSIELLLGKLEKILSATIEPQRNPPQFSIIPIFLDIEYLKRFSILYEPHIICLLSGLAGPIDGMYAQILTILRLLGMDDDHDVHIVLETDIPQPSDQRVLQLEFLEPLRLLRQHELQSVQHHHVDVVLLDRVDYRREDLIDVLGTMEVHEVQRQPRESIREVIELLQMLIHPQITVLVQHRGNQNLVANLETPPKNSDILLAEVQGQLREESCLSASRWP